MQFVMLKPKMNRFSWKWTNSHKLEWILDRQNVSKEEKNDSSHCYWIFFFYIKFGSGKLYPPSRRMEAFNDKLWVMKQIFYHNTLLSSIVMLHCFIYTASKMLFLGQNSIALRKLWELFLKPYFDPFRNWNKKPCFIALTFFQFLLAKSQLQRNMLPRYPGPNLMGIPETLVWPQRWSPIQE